MWRKKKGPTYLYNDEEKTYTPLSSNDNVTEESSGEMEKECNYNKDEKVDKNKRTSEEVVEYPIVKTKVIESNNTIVWKTCFKITVL